MKNFFLSNFDYKQLFLHMEKYFSNYSNLSKSTPNHYRKLKFALCRLFSITEELLPLSTMSEKQARFPHRLSGIRFQMPQRISFVRA